MTFPGEKMTGIGPTVYDFDSYQPITMSVIGSYDVKELNLHALFLFLPVTDRVLGPQVSLVKKQGKICFPPELNRPGEILSMRFDNQVRGIIRSEEPKSFPHSIIIDIGTRDRIISMKLSRSLKLNGPRSMEIAREAAQSVLDHMKRVQEDVEFIRTHQEVAHQVKTDLINYAMAGFALDESGFDEVGQRIARIFKQQLRGYPVEAMESFLNFMISFNRDLYTGSLRLEKLESEMVNIQYHLGFPINKMTFCQAIDKAPFIANYNTVKPAAPVNVFYLYTKFDLNGQASQAKHSIRVNRSGHIRHSGPNLEAMRPVYNAFIQRVLQNWESIQSIETGKQKVKTFSPARAYSLAEWRDLLRVQAERRERILAGQVPIATGESLPPKKGEPMIRLQESEDKTINDEGIIGRYDQRPHREEIPVISFNYSPLVRL